MSKIFTITDGLENMGALRTGGQGSVYKGRRIGPVITAVKLIPTPIHTESADDKNYRNFQNEVEKLKKVNEEPNPNVVKILNHGITESGSFPFIEMEFIEGPDLEDLLKPPHEKLFTVREVVRVADQLANALAHCHKVLVKHGDIKSNNVKFNINSNYILLDFGLSIMSDDQRRTSMRHAGAIEFMAPEQNEGAMYFQTDIYSYGIILFELLTGQVPFPLHDNGETSRNTVMLAHMEAPVPDIMALRRANLPESWTDEKKQHEMQVPAWLIKIISRCLEKQPENRYKNGIALQEAIVHESMLPNTQVQNTAELYALQQENERLQALTLHYQDIEAAKQVSGNKTRANGVLLKKPFFVLLLIMLLGFGAFSSYILFNRGWAKKIYHHFFNVAPVKAQVVKLDTPSTPQPSQSENNPVTVPADTIAQVHKDTNSMSKEDRQALLDSIKKDDTSKNLHF